MVTPASAWSSAISGLIIHRIRESKDNTPKILIKKIIAVYEKERQERIIKGYLTCNELKGFSWKPSNNHDFELTIYQFTKVGQGPLGTLLSTALNDKNLFKSPSYYFVIFFHRAAIEVKQVSSSQKIKKCWDIYALTSGDGWHVVRSYSDFNFPLKIALKVIDPKLSVIEASALAGDKQAVTETYRSEYHLQEFELETLWRIFHVFTSVFKEDSSFYQLEAFEKTDKVGVRVGEGKITIHHKLSFIEYSELLNYFSELHHGKPTFDVNNKKEEEASSFKYLQNIRPVDQATSRDLDKKLSQHLLEYLQGKRKFFHLNISHKYYRDYYTSSWFELKYEKADFHWQSPPSFHQIVECLRSIIKKPGSPEAVLTLLKEAKLKFSNGQKHNRNFPLIEFFAGELRDSKTHQVYFRNNGIWLQVAANHLVTLDSAFHQMLKSTLIKQSEPGLLPIPWIAEQAWASFSIQDAIDQGHDSKDIESVLGALQSESFSFVDKETKKVLVPYLTPCLFDNVKDRNFSCLISKRLEEINEVLIEHKGKKLEVITLEKILSEQTKKKTSKPDQTSKNKSSYASKLYNLLTISRPVFEQLSIASGGNFFKQLFIDEDGTILHSDFTGTNIRLKIVTTHIAEIQKYLTKLQKEEEKLVDKHFVSKLISLPGIGKVTAKKIIKMLKEPLGKKLKFKGRYIIKVRIKPDFLMPNGTSPSDELIKFFNTYHGFYKNVCKEEGYNRQFLGENGFIVCDQAYAGKKEKVELFDVLYNDSINGKLYLYHIKKKFGQPTREACAQIRVSAQTLIQDRARKYPILKELHKRSVNKKNNTSFNRALKKQFKDLSEQSADSSEAFITLFDKNPEDIVFVYAFVDTGSPERYLKDEKDPSHVFIDKDFKADNSNIIPILQKHEYLSNEARLTRKARTATKADWKKDLEKPLKKWEEIYDEMKKYISRFDSMGAKLELLHLRDHIQSNFSFGFKICQINREGRVFNPSTALDVPDSSSKSNEPVSDSAQSEENQEDIPQPLIEGFPVQEVTEDIVQSLTQRCPIELSNTGTDCFMNALLQGIFGDPLAYKWMATNPLQNQEVNRCAKEYALASENKVKRLSLAQNIRDQFSLIKGKDQWDFGDAYRSLTDSLTGSLEGDLSSTAKQVQEFNKGNPFVNKIIRKASFDFKEVDEKKIDSSNFNENTLTSEDFSWGLNIPLRSGQKSNTIESLLESYMIPPEGNRLHYTFTKKKGEKIGLSAYSETNVFEKLPEVLVINLKRNFSDGSFYFYDSLPIDLKETFELDPKHVKSKKGGTYTICHFACHIGQISSHTGISQGHYYCYKKAGNKWFYCNDNEIREAKNNEVNEKLRSSHFFIAHLNKEAKKNHQLAHKKQDVKRKKEPNKKEVTLESLVNDYINLYELHKRGKIDIGDLSKFFKILVSNHHFSQDPRYSAILERITNIIHNI